MKMLCVGVTALWAFAGVREVAHSEGCASEALSTPRIREWRMKAS